MIYSDNIDMVCRFCIYAEAVAGSNDHMRCQKRCEFVPLGFSCNEFEYDIFKKIVRKRRAPARKSYTADDFKL